MRFEQVHQVPQGFYNAFTAHWLRSGSDLKTIYPNDNERLQELIREYDSFDAERRKLLADTLLRQYGEDIHPLVRENIEALRNNKTFTVTTGQQIHIFLGPVFVIYKIWSVIRQARAIQKLCPDKRVVPVFWMATEDHDLAEIDHISLFGKEFRWQPETSGGPVGRIDSGLLQKLTSEIAQLAGPGQDFTSLLKPFQDAYAPGVSLAEATRSVINRLFGEDGLVVIDPDQEEFKQILVPAIKSDVLEGAYSGFLKEGTEAVEKAGFRPQVNPRKHHFFMVKNGKRLRIDEAGEDFVLHPGGIEVTRDEICRNISDNPGAFSPNVLLRPVYQQMVLPNLAYVCGPAELIYWHQIYPLFKSSTVPAPLLRLRDSFVWLDPGAEKNLEETGISPEQLWEGFESAAQKMQLKAAGDLKLHGIISALQSINDELKNELYRLKSPHLKELVKQGSGFSDNIKRELQRVENEIRTNGPYAPGFRKLEKLADRYFSVKSPQERSDSWLGIYLKWSWVRLPQEYSESVERHIFGMLFQH